MRVGGWTVRAAGEPMVLDERDEAPLPGDAIVAVAGCGVCHTDLGFYYEGVPTRHGFPLVLGHEISGVVVDAGTDERAWLGRKVVVPAVMPCGRCDACRDGRGAICPTRSSREAISTVDSLPTSAFPRAARCSSPADLPAISDWSPRCVKPSRRNRSTSRSRPTRIRCSPAPSAPRRVFPDQAAAKPRGSRRPHVAHRSSVGGHATPRVLSAGTIPAGRAPLPRASRHSPPVGARGES